MTEALRETAVSRPGQTAFTFLDAAGAASDLSYGDLDRQALAIAARLQQLGSTGQRALLLYPPGLEFVAAFLGCLYGGVIAVPAYPPTSERNLPRLLAITQDARPALALTTRERLGRLQPLAARLPGLGALAWVATGGSDEGDESEADLAAAWRDPRPGPEALAFLQYTSGSTAAPKGVMVSHGNLLHNEEMIRRAFGQSADSIIVGWLPLYHDMGLIGNVLQPLYLGARCILQTPAAFLQRPLSWLAAISRYRATTSGAPNFAYDLCVRKIGEEQRAGLDLASWEVAFNGAEPVRPDTLERFAAAFAPQGFRREAFYPCYGLAEATLFVSGGGKGAPPVVAAAGARGLVGCGHPWMDQRLAVVDPQSGRPAGAGQEGEIWISGPSVAQGYWGQPEATERDFRARLAGTLEDPGEGPFLRTGDLGFLSGGELFVTGRIKDLLIIRGRNLYPQDVERTVEESHPALRAGCGAAFAVEGDGEERLVVVQELDPHRGDEAGVALEALRQAVAEEHEVQVHQAVLVRAGTIPKTSSGKIQRHAARAAFLAGTLAVEAASALQAAAAGEPGDGIDRESLLALPAPQREVALRSALRERVARAMRLSPAELRADRPLTAFGLDSLAAIEIQHEMESALGVPLSLAALLQGATLNELTALARDGIEAAGARQMRAAPAVFPLSHGQRALWYLERLAPGNAAYILAGAGHLRGASAAVLRGSLAKLIERHPALRTVIETDSGDEPVQRVRPASDPPFLEVDATGWSEEEWRCQLAEKAYGPFDLGQGPLRMTLFHRPGGDEVLLLAVHHLAADFWSLEVLLQELAALVGGTADLAPLSTTYAAYVEGERQLLAGPRGEQLLAFWREQLGGELPQLDLPADRPRPRFQTFAGSVLARRFGRDLGDRLKGLGRERGATPYMTLLAAFCALLHRYTQQEDLLVGSPTSGRTSAGMAGLVGYFVNPVVVRANIANIAGEPGFGELLGRLRSTVLAAFAHQELPFPVLAQHLEAGGRDASRSPVFQTMFVFLQGRRSGPQGLAAAALGEAGARIGLGGLEIESLGLAPRGAQLDLTLWMAEEPEALHACLQFNTDLFDSATMARLLEHLAALLAGIAADPDAPVAALPLLSAAERQQTIAEWNDRPDAPPSTACLHQLVESQAEHTPEAVAVAGEGLSLTYRELNRRANQMAEHLVALGVGPEVVAGILTRRSPEMVVAMLAVLKAGGAYLPLDPAYPAERLAFMAADSRMSVVLTDGAGEGSVPPGVRQVAVAAMPAVAAATAPFTVPGRDGPFRSGAGPGNLAYVIYTSGSTGRPKGVAIEHRSAVALVDWALRCFPLADLAAVLASTSICFDLSVFELFVPLACGGSVILADNALTRPPADVAHRVTLINTVPSAMAELAQDAGLRASLRVLRTINLAGEPLPRTLVEQLAEHLPAARILNLYGPSEDTTYSTCALVESGLPQPPGIGRPVDGTRVYLLDRHLRPVPVGVPGEIALAGSGLARGYLGRPELTAERFLPDPFAAEPGARLYRTGDLARHLPSGELRFLSRLDHQVKVRGFRIELGEIEAVLCAHPAVREAVVAVAAGTASLVAWVAAGPGQEPTPAELRTAVARKLPASMVPSAFVLLPALPRTANGKVDRRALPNSVAAPTAPFVAPGTAVEERLAAIWAEVLQVERVGIHDDFFELGGHSLAANRVLSRVCSAFQVKLPLRDLLETPTVAGLEVAIAREMLRRAGARRRTA
ncbi:MAG TPA: amino acid adenylation domain-containing protein [Thermoanaerobaculia bacterium]|nr:amino acid adenylation domain-containing protein [Thermoanaerobaculia bacterium]